MARRKYSKKSVMNSLQPAIAGTVGFVLSKFVNRIPQVAANANLSAGAKIALGLALAFQKNTSVKSAGLGAMIAGLTDIANNNIPQLNSGNVTGINYRANANKHHVGRVDDDYIIE